MKVRILLDASSTRKCIHSLLAHRLWTSRSASYNCIDRCFWSPAFLGPPFRAACDVFIATHGLVRLLLRRRPLSPRPSVRKSSLIWLRQWSNIPSLLEQRTIELNDIYLFFVRIVEDMPKMRLDPLIQSSWRTVRQCYFPRIGLPGLFTTFGVSIHGVNFGESSRRNRVHIDPTKQNNIR